MHGCIIGNNNSNVNHNTWLHYEPTPDCLTVYLVWLFMHYCSLGKQELRVSETPSRDSVHFMNLCEVREWKSRGKSHQSGP